MSALRLKRLIKLICSCLTESQRKVLHILDNGVFDVQWSPSDALLATVAADKAARITDLTTGQTLLTLRGHTSTPKCVVWHAENDSLMSTGGRDNAICVWDIRVGEESRRHNNVDETDVLGPVLTINGAHGEETQTKVRRKTAKASVSSRTVTSLLHPINNPYGLVSSGSFDG